VLAIAEADERIEVLDDAAARDLIRQVESKFVEDPRRRWWWESLRGTARSVQYDSGIDGLELLRSRIAAQPMVNLIVTDNQDEPSGVVAGSPAAILELLLETPGFEFAMTDAEVRWLILDTHHDTLVMTGDVPLAEA
jgi:hypothetical protein